MTHARSLVELVRAPAALSVPGDSLAGAAAAGRPSGRRTPALAASSACLYWAGMALNDYADRDVDAVERPRRPIPSGRVRPRLALGLAGGLTATGLGLAGLAGGWRTLAVAGPLATTVWAYDLKLKDTAAGPAAMATARTCDVLLGAGAGRLRHAAPAALTLGTHTFTVTTLSRREVTGTDRRLPLATLAATSGVVAVTALRGLRNDNLRRGKAATAIPLGAYAVTFGRAQAEAVAYPSAHRLQRAVGAGILGMMPLQAALTAGAGAPRAAAAVLAAFPLARLLSRRVSPT